MPWRVLWKMCQRRTRRILIAYEVADYWRHYLVECSREDEAVDDSAVRSAHAAGAHALCCVLSALDGVEDPAELGIGPSSADAQRIRNIIKS